MIRKLINRSLILLIIGMATIFLLNSKNPATPNDTENNQATSLPTSLNPVVKKKSSQLLQQAAQKGIVIVITDDYRSFEDQNRLYAQGRSTPGKIVTNAKAGESYHNYGLAIDFALKTPSGNVIWDRQYDGNKNGKADWAEVVRIAKSLGFQWGGDWARIKDYPHLQIDFGLTIADLQNGKRPNPSSLVADNS